MPLKGEKLVHACMHAAHHHNLTEKGTLLPQTLARHSKNCIEIQFLSIILKDLEWLFRR